MLHTGAHHLPVYLRSLLVGHVEAQRLFTFFIPFKSRESLACDSYYFRARVGLVAC